MEAPKTPQQAQHNADRHARELYRYYQPAPQDSVVPSWFPAGEEYSLSSVPSDSITPPISVGSGRTNSTATSRPAVSVTSDSLTLGTTNSTLTSFAQLAALRLNVERAFLAVLDRDKQHIIAEATRTISLTDPSVHEEDDDHIWLGTSDTRKSWSVCKVSLLTRRAG
jgi:hypothetical protein